MRPRGAVVCCDVGMFLRKAVRLLLQDLRSFALEACVNKKTLQRPGVSFLLQDPKPRWSDRR